MDLLIVVLIAAVWFGLIAFTLALCKLAAWADAAQEERLDRTPSRDRR